VRRWSQRHGCEGRGAGACDVNPVVVGEAPAMDLAEVEEAISKDPMVDLTAIDEVTEV
jgi:hypothetical protein